VLRIGLTGGIGSGKSTVSGLFTELGVELLDADDIVHRLSQPGQPAFDAIVRHFGTGMLQPDGNLDRAALRERIFSDPVEKQALEDILHPAVRHWIDSRLPTVSSPYCVLAIPLLLETGYTDLCDRILVVMANRDIRQARVQQRSGLSASQIEAIMATQVTDQQRLQAADDIITNESSIDHLRQQVARLDRKYRRLSASR
jgi:dephospho-CoA kinase